MKDKVFVSILVPCYNEEYFIEELIQNVADQDFGQEHFELILIDGMSKDLTFEKAKAKSGIIKNFIILQNPKKTVPFAMNEGIRQAKGEIIVRLDAHASYPSNYVSLLVQYLQELNADNVGGIWITKPYKTTTKGKAIAIALSTSFGVGNSMFRIGVDEPTETDTVPFGCYRKEIFNKIGFYDERLDRNQDIELNKRLKSNGGKIYLIPEIHSIYYSRNSYVKLIENNYKNGLWVILTAYYTKSLRSLSLRHYIPLLFLLYLISIPVLALLTPLFIIPALVYFFLLSGISVSLALKNKNFALFPYVFTSIFLLHTSYGSGSIVGIVKTLKLILDGKQ